MDASDGQQPNQSSPSSDGTGQTTDQSNPPESGESSAAEAFAEGQQRADEEHPESSEPGEPATAAATPSDEETGEEPPNGVVAASSGQPPSPEDERTEQWLRQIPDDPAGLLRRKFQYEADVNAIRNRFAPPGGNRDEERY